MANDNRKKDRKAKTMPRRLLTAGLVAIGALLASAEVQVINGVKYACEDGVCMIVDDDAPAAGAETPAVGGRIAQGYMPSADFIRFLAGEREGPADAGLASAGEATLWLGLLLVLLGGLAMNLTPCVLPMIPINLMIIGKSAARGAWYGLGIALAYGALGVAAALGGLAFGTIQGSPWFNLGVAALFIALALALSGVFFIDLSKGRGGLARRKAAFLPWLFAFFMGVVSAVLAGACVAPILISVLVLTGKLYAEGKVLALGLPFVFGLGMGLPWPFLGAGLKVLPKPGAWMKWVNRLFAVVVLGFAAWYAHLAWRGFSGRAAGEGAQKAAETASNVRTATPETFEAVVAGLPRPVLVDCWATWCKNCAAMDRVMGRPEVRKALERFSVVRLQAEDMRALNALKGFETVRGLPAFVILGD